MAHTHYSIADYIRCGAAVTVFFGAFLIATPIVLFLLLISLGYLTNPLIRYVAPIIMKPVFFVGGVSYTVKRHGPPVQEPAMYVINHSSTIDLLAILALGLPRVRFVAKWELQYNPIFFVLGRLTGQIFIKRQRSTQAITTLKRAYDRIQRHNLSVLMAPEGSRKHKGVVGPFKKGPFHMAMALDMPIVPIYFEGSQKLSSGKSLLFKRGHVTAHIHPPVDTSGWEPATIDQHVASIRNRYLDWAGVPKDAAEEKAIAE